MLALPKRGRVMKSLMLGVLAAWTLAVPGVSPAEPGPRLLRVVGETAAASAGAPRRFVIDAVLTPGESAFQSQVEGWYAELAPGQAADEIEGSCVEARCALSVDTDAGKLAVSADLAGPGAPGAGRLALTGDDGQPAGEVQVRFIQIKGPVAGLGELAAPDAIKAAELSDLLLWNGAATGFTNSDDEEVDWLQRRALAEWQGAHERSPSGLVLVEDLAALRSGAAAAKAAAGWKTLGDPAKGWRAGYPAALLPVATRLGAEQRFSSPAKDAELVLAIDPPLDEAGWDAFVEKVTEDRPAVESRSYTRVNDDMELRYEEKGRVFSAAYHRRPGGLARAEFSYPVARKEAWAGYEILLPRSLSVTDDLAR